MTTARRSRPPVDRCCARCWIVASAACRHRRPRARRNGDRSRRRRRSCDSRRHSRFPRCHPPRNGRRRLRRSRTNEVIEFSWAGETARHVGTVVHRWLQRLADDALAGWTPARIEALRPRLARELERRGVRPAECRGRRRARGALARADRAGRARPLAARPARGCAQRVPRAPRGRQRAAQLRDGPRIPRRRMACAGSRTTRPAATKAAMSKRFSIASACATKRNSRVTPRRSASRRPSWDCISRCSPAGASGNNRRSDRHFDGRPVAQQEIDLLIEAFRWAPSSTNRQPWRLIFATSAVARAAYDDALSAGNKQWACAAPVKIVVVRHA